MSRGLRVVRTKVNEVERAYEMMKLNEWKGLSNKREKKCGTLMKEREEIRCLSKIDRVSESEFLCSLRDSADPLTSMVYFVNSNVYLI